MYLFELWIMELIITQITNVNFVIGQILKSKHLYECFMPIYVHICYTYFQICLILICIFCCIFYLDNKALVMEIASMGNLRQYLEGKAKESSSNSARLPSLPAIHFIRQILDGVEAVRGLEVCQKKSIFNLFRLTYPDNISCAPRS